MLSKLQSPVIASLGAPRYNTKRCDVSCPDPFLFSFYFFFFFILGLHCSMWKFPGSRGRIGAAAAGLCHSHSNEGSKLCLRPTPQVTAMLNP